MRRLDVEHQSVERAEETITEKRRALHVVAQLSKNAQMTLAHCLPEFLVASCTCREMRTATFLPVFKGLSSEETRVLRWLAAMTTSLLPQR